MPTIKVRRGLNASLPAGGTEAGEPRFSTDTGQLYVDNGTANVEITPNATNVGAAINSVSTDDTIDDTDTFGYTTGSTLKKSAWSNIKSLLTTVFNALYAPIAKGVTNGDTHDHNGGDGGTIAYSSLSGTPTIPVKATGAEVDTGTDDAKFATPKAMEDSSYIKAAYADAKVADAITDGVTTIAPSENAVFDALALKIDTSTLDTGGTLAANSDAKIATQKATKTYADAKVADAINDGTTTIAPSQNAVFDALALKIATSVLDTDATLAANSDAKIPSQKAIKTYVDAIAQGLDIKASVRVATTANITLSGTQTIDGVAAIAGDRVLVKDQSTGADNGIYVVAAGAWARSTDADSSAKVTAGMFAFVSEGTVNGDNGFALTTNDPITLGSTSLTFTQVSGVGQITAGNALTKTGNTLDWVPDGSTLEVSSDQGRIKDAGVTLAKLANIATDSLIGRDTASSGVPENILLNATLSMDGSGNLQRAALSGDISASAGSNTTAIGAGKVLTAMIADAQLTLAKMADLAQSTIIGRAAGAGTGVPTALSVAQVVAMINATLDHNALTNLATGDVHAHYALLAGRSGGQSLSGGTAANDDLTLQGTTNGTRTTSYVLLQPNGGKVGIGTTTPTYLGHAVAASGANAELAIDATGAGTGKYGALFVQSDQGYIQFASFGSAASGTRHGQALAGAGDLLTVTLTKLLIGTADANPIYFGTNNSLRMMIDASGNVAIGPSTAAAQLDVLQPTLGDAVQRLASTATNDDPVEIVYQNRVATTNATITTLHTFTVPSSTTYFITGQVVARRTGGSAGTAEDGAAYTFSANYKNVAGTATLIGPGGGVTSLSESQAGWDCVLSLSGATVLLRVTGATNNNITWHMTARVYLVSS